MKTIWFFFFLQKYYDTKQSSFIIIAKEQKCKELIRLAIFSEAVKDRNPIHNPTSNPNQWTILKRPLVFIINKILFI